jgi:cytoskeleton protein RodZ
MDGDRGQTREEQGTDGTFPNFLIFQNHKPLNVPRFPQKSEPALKPDGFSRPASVQFRRHSFRAENRLPSFGHKLKTEREKRGITLDQISSSTKIGIRMLQALEEDNFDQLPGGIFNKGFVRAYARHVGLDEDQMVADYLQASGEAPPPQPDLKVGAEIPAPERDSAPPRQIPRSWLAGALLLIALALFIWSRSHHQNEIPKNEIPRTEVPAVPAATDTKPDVESSRVASSVPPSKEVAPPAKPVPGNETNPAKAAAVQSAATAGEFTVVILAREDSWLSIAVDGQPPNEETLTGENQHAIHARNQVVIKAGNVGALDFIFNGKKIPSQGDFGDVKTLTFGPDGLQPKAPAPPPPTQ